VCRCVLSSRSASACLLNCPRSACSAAASHWADDGAAQAARDIRNALFAAAERGDVGRVTALLLNGAASMDVRTPGGQPLLDTAVRSCSLTLVRTLLELGADTNVTDREGFSPAQSARFVAFGPLGEPGMRALFDDAALMQRNAAALAVRRAAHPAALIR